MMRDCRKGAGPSVLAVCLAALLLASCGKKAETPPEELPGAGGYYFEERNDTAESVQAAGLQPIETLIEEGSYYEAFREILLYEEQHPESEARTACEALYDRLEPLVREHEPASGTELARSFRYYGGGELQAVAKSGALLITVTDAETPQEEGELPAYSRFYVRAGETGTILLPAGVYRVSYQVGYLWFNEEIGFGDYWSGGELDELLVFEVSTSGSVTNNSRYTLTF